MNSVEKLFLLLTFWVEIHWLLLSVAQTVLANAQFCGSTWFNILCETLFLMLSPNSHLVSCWTLMKTAYCSYTMHNALLLNFFPLQLNSDPSSMPSPCKWVNFYENCKHQHEYMMIIMMADGTAITYLHSVFKKMVLQIVPIPILLQT